MASLVTGFDGHNDFISKLNQGSLDLIGAYRVRVRSRRMVIFQNFRTLFISRLAKVKAWKPYILLCFYQHMGLSLGGLRIKNRHIVHIRTTGLDRLSQFGHVLFTHSLEPRQQYRII